MGWFRKLSQPTHKQPSHHEKEMNHTMNANTRQFETELAAQDIARTEQVELHAEATVTTATTL